MRALWLVEDCVICRYNHLGGDYGRGIKFQTRCYAFRHKSHLGRERKRQLTTTHEAKRPARNWVEYIAPLCFRSDLAVVVSAIFVLEYHLECHFVSCHQILVLLVLLHNFTKHILEIVMTVVLSLFYWISLLIYDSTSLLSTTFITTMHFELIYGETL